MSLPEYLDWMPIEAKIEYFRYIGSGSPKSTHLLLKSQGEEQLSEVTLTPKNYLQFKELTNGAEAHIDRYCIERGISRQPRNQ